MVNGTFALTMVVVVVLVLVVSTLTAIQLLTTPR